MSSAPIDNPYLDAYTRGNFPGEQQENEFGYSPLYHYWYWNYPYHGDYVAHTYVSLEASVVQVSDGKVLYATPVPATGGAGTGPYHSARGPTSPQGAMHEAVNKLVADLAVVPVGVPVHPNTAMRTATGRVDVRWDFSNSFSATDQTMYVVLELPATGRSAFRLTVTPTAEPGRVVVTKDFAWPAGQTTDSVQLSPREIAAGTGPGQYTIHLYSLGQLALEHNVVIQ